MCVSMSIGRDASDCSAEVADATFPVEVNLPVNESTCACSILLEGGHICKVGGVQSGQGPVLDRSERSERL
jgi:hypothetical protein